MPVRDLPFVENGGVAVLCGKKVGTALAVVLPEQSLRSKLKLDGCRWWCGGLAERMPTSLGKVYMMKQGLC